MKEQVDVTAMIREMRDGKVPVCSCAPVLIHPACPIHGKEQEWSPEEYRALIDDLQVRCQAAEAERDKQAAYAQRMDSLVEEQVSVLSIMNDDLIALSEKEQGLQARVVELEAGLNWKAPIESRVAELEAERDKWQLEVQRLAIQALQDLDQVDKLTEALREAVEMMQDANAVDWEEWCNGRDAWIEEHQALLGQGEGAHD